MSLSVELFRVGGEHISVTIQYGISRRAQFPARGEPRGAAGRGAAPPAGVCGGAKGHRERPQPPRKTAEHIWKTAIYLYIRAHMYMTLSIPPIHRPSSSSHELARPSLKRHAGYTTAGPGTVAFGFVASAAAAAVASLSREYFVAAPMTTMVAN